ncbi:MAG: large ribosomal subunit protein bL35 [Candidatus Komeilibacteria bacterium]
MPKLKTRKAVAKRIKVTKNNKLKIRAGGQDHFNARETGKKKRNKRRDKDLAKVNHKNIRATLPYS